MAEANISEFQDHFCCSICLNLLKDPVTVPCGHSFCMICITDCWNIENTDYSCPQCRQTFTPRPALGRNMINAEMVENVEKTNFQTDGSGPSYAGPEDVECDVCTGRKRKAVKSCLVCLELYCQTHFERHEEFHSGKCHKVTEATGRLQEMICSQHDRLMEVYCRTDQTFICFLCMMDEHKNHDTVLAAVERTEKQRLVETNQRNVQERIEQKEKKLKELREAVKTHKSAVGDTERIFIELIRSIKRKRSDVIQLIRDQEKTAVSRAEGVLKELEQEIDDLRRKQDEIKKLSHTDDHISFLQKFESLSESSGSTDVITVSPLPSFDDVRKSVIQLKEKVDDLCAGFHLFSLDPNTVNNNVCLSEENTAPVYTDGVQQYPDHPDGSDDSLQIEMVAVSEVAENGGPLQDLLESLKVRFGLQNFESLSESSGSTDIITVSPLPSFDDVGKSVIQPKEKVDDLSAGAISVSSMENIPINESMTSRELLQYFHLFTLDPNTVNNKVSLSEENRKATGKKTVQPYPDHPDRFACYHQVLCRESVSGRCYWEVEWSGSVRISVSYKSINTKGRTIDCMFGRNDESWCLLCSSAKFSFWHNNKQTKLPVVSRSSRIGVFVDHSAGILSFYSVSHTMTLIHRVHTTFTQPLYPGFLIPRNSKMKLLKF